MFKLSVASHNPRTKHRLLSLHSREQWTTTSFIYLQMANFHSSSKATCHCPLKVLTVQVVSSGQNTHSRVLNTCSAFRPVKSRSGELKTHGAIEMIQCSKSAGSRDSKSCPLGSAHCPHHPNPSLCLLRAAFSEYHD